MAVVSDRPMANKKHLATIQGTGARVKIKKIPTKLQNYFLLVGFRQFPGTLLEGKGRGSGFGVWGKVGNEIPTGEDNGSHHGHQ